jgi:hypothetical protein
MFVLRTVMVSPCSEGAVSASNINRQHFPPMLCYASTKIYGITIQKAIIVIFSQSDVTLAKLLAYLFIQQAACEKHRVTKQGHAI